jgi:mycothiol S-conjugate amidase
VSVAAFGAAGDADAYRDSGAPWQPLKLYYVGFSGERVLAMHAKFLELGLESPFDDAWLERARTHQRKYTTRIDVSGYGDVRRRALLAHATQIDPESPFWFGLPPEVMQDVHPVDEYILAARAPGADDIESAAGDPGSLRLAADVGVEEDDLFAGVGDPANR